jgi:hypothetical protein
LRTKTLFDGIEGGLTMKSKLFFATLLVVFMGFGTLAFASSQGVQVISGVVSDYYGKTPNVSDLGGNKYKVTGPGGTQVINFSPELISRLETLRTRPDAGQSLDTMCPTQARQIRLAMAAKAQAPKASPCTAPDCTPADKPNNPQWQEIPPRTTLGGFTFVHGQIDDRLGCRIQRKWYSPDGEIQIVETNCSQSDPLIAVRLQKAVKGAQELSVQMKADKPRNCGKNNCYVCEY